MRRFVIWLLIGSVALPLSAAECTVPTEVSTYLENVIAPEILELFHPCVLNGSWPTMYFLKQKEIFGLRSNPDFEEMYVSLNNIDPTDLTSVQKEILRTWVSAGARIYVGKQVEEWLEEVFKVAHCGIIGKWYQLAPDKNEVILSDMISFDVEEIEVCIPSNRGIEYTENEVASLIKVIYRDAEYSVVGALRLGSGLIVYNFMEEGLEPYTSTSQWLRGLKYCFSKPDGARLLLNIRQWLSGLNVPGKTLTFIPPRPNHDIFFMKNGDIISGILDEEEFLFETELYGTRSYKIVDMVCMEHTEGKWFLLHLRDGSRIRVSPVAEYWKLVPLTGNPIRIPTSEIETCAFRSGG